MPIIKLVGEYDGPPDFWAVLSRGVPFRILMCIPQVPVRSERKTGRVKYSR